MKIIIEEWDGDGAIRIPDEALQELERKRSAKSPCVIPPDIN